ncbi:MAG: hypothetical protein Q9208_002124 [Pyrenodesmia sp. 3 TL-2023]
MQSLIPTPTATLARHNNRFRQSAYGFCVDLLKSANCQDVVFQSVCLIPSFRRRSHDPKASASTVSSPKRDAERDSEYDVSNLLFIVEGYVLIAKDRGPIPVNDILTYHVPGTTINLYLMDTGDRLPLEDITGCLHLIRSDIAWYINSHIQSPSTTRIVGKNRVRVVFTPRRMTWTTAAKVIEALGDVITNENWTWTSHVTISDVYLGLIGNLGIQYRAPVPNPPSSDNGDTRLSSPARENSTLLASTLRNTSLTLRPESPYPYVIPGSHISIVCAGYGPALDAEAVFSVLFGAQMSVARKVKQFGPLATMDRVIPWRLGDVWLEVWPHAEARLRWCDLLTALEGVVDFVRTFETFAFTFDIRWQGYRSLGFGQLRMGQRGRGGDSRGG